MTQTEAFAALAEANPEAFAFVRELAANFFALRDATATELHYGQLRDDTRAAFALADTQADATVAALATLDA